MFDVNDCISNSIDLNYLLGKFVLELRAVIRIFDKDGYILQTAFSVYKVNTG